MELTFILYLFFRDTPPEPPKNKLFYPIPLSAAHQHIIGCIKKVCQSSRSELLSDSGHPVTATVNEGTADELCEKEDKKEDKAPNCGSPDPKSKSPEIDIGSPDQCKEVNSGSSEMNHQQNSTSCKVLDNKVNGKLSLQLGFPLSDKGSRSQNCELSEQRASASSKQSDKLLEQNKKSPGRLSIQNSRLLVRSPEQVGRSHDQNGASPEDRGKMLDISDIEKTLKLQINRLCQQELYQLFNKPTEQQVHRTLEAMTNTGDKFCNPCNNLADKSIKKMRPCTKSSRNKFGQSSHTTEATNCGNDEGCGLLSNMAPMANHLSGPVLSVIKTPPLLNTVPPKYRPGLKRESPSTLPSTKRSCDDTCANFLAILPEATTYGDIIVALKRCSESDSNSSSFTTPVCQSPLTRDWQLLHSIYHDHSYSVDYVPLQSGASQEQPAAVCDGCAERPVLICENCKRYFHYWCLLPGRIFCEDCISNHNIFPLA